MCPPNRYLKYADEKGVEPVAERVYRRVLTQKVFTKYRKDHCMCTTCLRTGWRGTHVHIYNHPPTQPPTHIYTQTHTRYPRKRQESDFVPRQVRHLACGDYS